jgi:hypothetical protein
VRESCALEAGILSSTEPLTLHERGRDAEWRRLLQLADPNGVLAAEEREDAARRLQREKLIAAGRKGADTYRQRAERQRAFEQRLDDMIAHAEELLAMLRAGRAA